MDGDHVRLRLAGGLAVTVDGAELPATRLGSRRARTLLGVLAAQRPRPVPAAELAAVLWPGPPPRDPAAGVATLVSRLRGVLGPDAITGDRSGYRLTVRADLDDALALAAEAERRLEGAPALALMAARGALDLADADVLPAEGDWAEPLRRRRAEVQRRARRAGAAAALATGDVAAALALAGDAVAADPLDEPACRQLMAAHHATGAPAAAVAAYERLRAALAEDLGIDPSPLTRQLHLAVLRGEPVPQDGRTDATAAPPALLGRDEPFAVLLRAWQDAVAGRAGTVLVAGEAGIGKSRLVAELAAVAERTGATALRARCFESERSLMLQPLVDVCAPLLARTAPGAVREVVGDDGPLLAELMPELAGLLGPPAEVHGPIGFRRARTFGALARLFLRLATLRPVLLLIDDVHNASASTLDFLQFLARRMASARLLVVAAARTEELAPVPLETFGLQVELGPLDRAAVHGLAARHGLAAQADSILARTSGHTLYVVEVIRALAAGSAAPPPSLAAAVLDRVQRLGADAELLRGAAVLHSAFDPDVLAALLRVPPPRALAGCEHALRAGLLVESGRDYHFAHDLVREVLYASMPGPTRTALHRRAADVRTDRPELVGEHAALAGDWERAARAWLAAGEAGLARMAVSDGEALATRALQAAQTAADAELQARALLLRGRARDVASAWAAAYADVQAAVELAREAGDRRLEMVALRQCGGDIPVALGRPVSEFSPHIDLALQLAASLGDRAREADLRGRLAVLRTNELRFTEALAHGEQAVAAARASGDETALVLGLDGLKSALAYLGEVDRLAGVVADLEPLLRQRADLFLLQWTVFESAFVPLARGDHAAAESRMAQAGRICRGAGYQSYEGWFLTHVAWSARLRGDLPAALRCGERAERSADEFVHAWWYPAALATHAATLLRLDRRAEAISRLERALPVAERGTQAYQLRCLAVLAEASGSAELLARADGLLAACDCPPGSAWLLGADAYLALARAWAPRDPARARAVLAGPLAAARRTGWVPLVREFAALERSLAATGLQRHR